MPPVVRRIDATSIITAFYRVLLMREPEPEGLAAHVQDLERGVKTVEQALATFVSSDEFQMLIPRMLEAHKGGELVRFTNDQSQFGEIEFLIRQWVNEAARHRIVVDVGARGKDRSNSFDLLRTFGWKGLLIEANTALIENIRSEFAGLSFALLNVAVSDYEGQAEFYIGVNDDVSSLNKAASETWGKIQSKITVPVRRLHPLLSSYNVPLDFDLLSLDIEGDDLKVLNDLVVKSAYRPLWIVIEASYNFNTTSLDQLDLVALVKEQYSIVGQTEANLILRYRPPA